MVGDTVVGGAIGLLSAVVGVLLADWLGAKRRREDRDVADRNRWREIGASTAAKARLFLAETQPELVTGDVFAGQKEAADDRLADLTARLLELQEPVATLVDGHPSEQVQRLADRLLVELRRVLNGTGRALFELSHNDNGYWAQNDDGYKKTHAAAESVRSELARALHFETTKNTTVPGV